MDGGGGSDGSTACTTSFGAGNPVQYAFNGGANSGWYQFIPAQGDLANSGLTTSLGASFTDGHSCPGALQFAVNFTAYGPANAHGESGATETFYGTSPNGRNWSAYKNLHAWVKLTTSNYPEIDSVFFYVKSGAGPKYQNAVGTGAALSNGQWQELVVDLTVVGTGPFNGVSPNDIGLIGFEVLLKSAPPAGSPAAPTQAILLVDDIWLEALPASDGGADGPSDGASSEGG